MYDDSGDFQTEAVHRRRDRSITIAATRLIIGSFAVGSLLFIAHQPAGAQADVISILRPPKVAHTAARRDPNHPPPAPGAGPLYRPGPGPAAKPLPRQWPPDAEEEDTQNLVRMWQNRRSPQDFQTLINNALAMPAEPASRPRQLQANGLMQPLAAVTNSWSQIGAGDINNDGVHHQSGRERGSAYAWDNSQGSTVLWLGSTGGGLWRAVILGIFGAVFVPVSDSLPGSPSVGAFLVHPGDSSRILIGTGDSYRYGGTGLYKTTDGGATWSLIPGSWPSAFQKIIDDYNDSTGNTVLAEGDTGIWRSTDFGSTWTQVYSGAASDLVQDPNYPWIWYAGAPGVGVLRSTSYGTSFGPIGYGISTPIGRVSVAVSAAASWHVYALTEGTFGNFGGIWRSDSYGDNQWTSLESTDHIGWGQAEHTCAIGVDPADADRLFVGMGGMQWTQNATANPPTWNYTSDGGHADFTSFNFEQGTTNVIITNDGGVYTFDYSSNSVSGTLNELGLNCQQTMGPVDCLAGARTVPDLLLAGLQDNGMIRIDRNDSTQILELGGGDGGASSISPEDPNTFIFSSGTAYNRYYSTDQGATWVGINYFLPNNWVPTVMIDQTPSNGFTPYIYTYSDVYVWYKPVDNSDDWQAANSTPLPNGYNPRGMDASNDTNAYVFYIESWGSGELYVMDSYSDGPLGSMGWEVRTPPLPFGSQDNDCQIAADRSSLRPYTITYTTGASKPSRAFLSNDRGQTWADVTGDLTTKLPNANYWKLIANPADQTQLFLATDVGVFRSDNGGVNWYSYMNGLPAVASVVGMELNYDNASPPLLHIGTYGRGFWDRQVAADSVLQSVTVDAPPIIGGRPMDCVVWLDRDAPVDATVSLTSSNPALVPVPSTVTVSAGYHNAGIVISTGAVTQNTPVTITATYNQVQKSVNFTLLPMLGSVSLSPSTVTGGVSSKGTVTLNGPASGSGFTVALSSSNSSVAYPAVSSLTVPSGKTSATFTVKTNAVTSNTSVSIKASGAGASASGTLTVNALALSALSVSPSTVIGGANATGKVTLNGPAPTGGASIALSSTNSAASVPSTVTVPAGASSVSFTITTNAVTTAASGNITAKFKSVTLSQPIKVVPITVASLTLSPNPVIGGNNVSGTVTLTAPAAPGSITVTLSSSNTAVAAPTVGSIVIPAGSKTGTFTVKTSKVTATKTATIKATANGTSASKALTVNP